MIINKDIDSVLGSKNDPSSVHDHASTDKHAEAPSIFAHDSCRELWEFNFPGAVRIHDIEKSIQVRKNATHDMLFH